MKKRSIIYLLIFVIIATTILCCKKYNEHNISFCGLSVSDAKKYAIGNWHFLYSYGGIFATTTPGRNNMYLMLTDNRIKMGNDSAGILVDTDLSWQQGDGQSGNCINFQYVFSPSLPTIVKILDRISNDTLVIHDKGSDPVFYYYKRN